MISGFGGLRPQFHLRIEEDPIENLAGPVLPFGELPQHPPCDDLHRRHLAPDRLGQTLPTPASQTFRMLQHLAAML